MVESRSDGEGETRRKDRLVLMSRDDDGIKKRKGSKSDLLPFAKFLGLA